MRVLVAGGTGLIGWHATRELVARGHEVRVLARRQPRPELLPEGVEFVAGDLVDGDLSAAAQGIDAVVHAAGVDPRVIPKGSAWAFFKRVNVDGSLRLFRAALEAGAQRGVFVTSYYHAVRPEVAEDHPYLRSRVVSEREVSALCGEDLALAVIQPSWVMGPIRGRPSLGKALAKYTRGRLPLFAPPGGTNFVSATSLAQAIAAALDHPGAHVIGDENLTWAAVMERFCKAHGRPRRVRTLPGVLLTSAALGLDCWWHLIRQEYGVRPVAWSRLMAEELYFDPGPAQEALGFERGNLDLALSAIVSR